MHIHTISRSADGIIYLGQNEPETYQSEAAAQATPALLSMKFLIIVRSER